MNWRLAGWGTPLLERTLGVVVDVKLNVSRWHVLAALNTDSTLCSVDRSRWEMEGCDHSLLLGIH